MYCPKCGKTLEEDAKFCPNCGYRTKTEKVGEETKEINISILKNVEKNSSYDFSKKTVQVEKKQQPEKTNNNIIIYMCLIVILLLIIVLLLVSRNKKNYIFEEEKTIYCNDNYESKVCEEKKEEIITDFDSMDFTEYDFSESSSKESFYSSIIKILEDKSTKGNKYCNNQKYNDANNKLNNNLGSNYSYLCGLDTSYLDYLITRLNQFYQQNNINDKIVDAYVVGKGNRNEYANYNGETIGSNNNYIAYLRRIYINISMFSDYDKLKKTYERDLQNQFHPKNSNPEDIIVHETAHALDYYISAKRIGIGDLVLDDFSKYSELYESWGNQTYAKEVVQKAVKRVNDIYKQNGQPSKTEEELKKEISGYAEIIKDGVIMYAETFAEALVDYLANNQNASDLSIEIHKIVQEDLKKL